MVINNAVQIRELEKQLWKDIHEGPDGGASAGKAFKIREKCEAANRRNGSKGSKSDEKNCDEAVKRYRQSVLAKRLLQKTGLAKRDDELSAGTIGLIVSAVLIGLLILALLIWYCCCRRGRRYRSSRWNKWIGGGTGKSTKGLWAFWVDLIVR